MNGTNGKKPQLAFLLRVKVEKRERYFAAITKPFAITAYGDTAEVAEHRAMKAVSLLLGRHGASYEDASEFLRRRKVKIAKPSKENRPVVSECSREMVLAGDHA